MTLVLTIIVALALLVFLAAAGTSGRAEQRAETVSVRAAVRPRRHRPF